MQLQVLTELFLKEIKLKRIQRRVIWRKEVDEMLPCDSKLGETKMKMWPVAIRQRRVGFHHRGMCVVGTFPWSHWLIISCDAAMLRVCPSCDSRDLTSPVETFIIFKTWTLHRAGQMQPGQILSRVQSELMNGGTLLSLRVSLMQSGSPRAMCCDSCCLCCTWGSAGKGRSLCWGGFGVPHNLEAKMKLLL